MIKNRYLLLLAFALGTVYLSSLTFLIDGSGSMKGFANTGSITSLVDEIEHGLEPGSSTIQYMLFHSNTPTSLETIPLTREVLGVPSTYNGKFTLLGEMAEKVFNEQSTGNYVIITDNVDDDPYTRGESAKFYAALNENQVITSIDVSPRILPFSGNPCRGHRSSYNGNTGLIVYFVSTHLDDGQRRERSGLLNSLKGKGDTLFHIRPITAEHINLKTPKGTQGGFEIYSKGGKYHLRVRSQRSGVPNIQIDKENRIQFSILMKSHYQYIGIRENTEVKIENFRIKSKGDYLRIRRPDIKISPSKLPHSLEIGGAQLFDVKIILKPMRASFKEKLRAMFSTQKCTIEFDLVLETGRNNLYMTQIVADQYFTDNVSDYSKIYSSEDIVSYFNPLDNKLVLPISNENNSNDHRTQIKIVYDNMALFIGMLLIFILIVGGALWIIKYFSSPPSYKLKVKYLESGKLDAHDLGRISLVRLDCATVRRRINRVTVQLNDLETHYFRNSIFKTVDLPMKIELEIVDKAHNTSIKISLDK